MAAANHCMKRFISAVINDDGGASKCTLGLCIGPVQLARPDLHGIGAGAVVAAVGEIATAIHE